MWKTILSDKKATPKSAAKSKKKSISYGGNVNPTMRRLSQVEPQFTVPEFGVTNSTGAPMSLVEDLIPKVVDTSLFVGPVYDSTKRRQGVIKDQLGDITQRLHKTLHEYDVMEEVERSPPRLEILENLTRNIDTIDRQELKGHLEGFMSQYKDLTSSVEESNKEREELLLQVADWLTTDHTDLDDLKTSFDDDEANQMNSEYVSTLADLEKLKSLKEEIIKSDFNGKNTKYLEQEKKRLEKNVMEGLTEMNQNKQKGGSQPEDAHWKHAADEVVQLLNKVRLENADEKQGLADKMTELVSQIDRQHIQVRSLQGEVRREKNVAAHLADDNADLTKEVLQLRAKLQKYEKDLEHAKKVIERQLSNLDTDMDSSSSGSSVEKSLSEVLQVKDSNILREISSDPAILRSALREQKEMIEGLTKELKKAGDRMKEVELTNMEMDIKIEELENMPPEVITETTTIVNEVVITKAPSFCKCHLTPEPVKKTQNGQHSAAKAFREYLTAKEIDLDLYAPKEEMEKLTEKIQYYKKALYDTEMKLSDAIKEIAELRMLVDNFDDAPPQKPPTPVQRTPSPEPIKEEVEEAIEEEEVEEKKVVVRETPAPPQQAKLKKGSVEEPPKLKSRQAPPKPKPVRKNVPKKPPPSKKKSNLPPIRHRNPAPPLPDMDISRSEREQILWTVGELQAMLNGIIQDVMEFSTVVGNMIYKEKEGEQIQQPALRTFDFGQTPTAIKPKSKKPITNRKELEARDKKSQVFFLGQRAVGTIREIYEILSASLELLHEEFEMIYRSFKDTQDRKALEKALLSGDLPKNLKLPGHEATGGPGSDSATAESLLTYYVHAYGQLQKSQERKKGGASGYTISRTEHRSKSISITSIASNDSANTMQNAVMVLGIHRSKSEVDINSAMSNDSNASMKRSQTHIFVSTKVNESVRPEVLSVTREEAKIATTTVPKKGLIKLTALGEELDGKFIFGKTDYERDDTSPMDLEEIERQRRKHSMSQGKQKMLIRRKNIQDQLMIGQHLLEEELKQSEEKVDMEKALEEYTMGELQNNMSEYIGSKKKGVPESRSKGKVYDQPRGT